MTSISRPLQDNKISWDDDTEEIPPTTTTENPDGTKTTISYKYNENGKLVKITTKIKTTVQKVQPQVAERKNWTKFGFSFGDSPGPSNNTTTLTEEIPFKLAITTDKSKAEEIQSEAAQNAVNQLKHSDTSVKCRVCSGDHFTSKCPMKGLVHAPEAEAQNSATTPASFAAAAATSTRSSYVAPHLRNRGGAPAAGGSDRSTGQAYADKEEATLRVSSLGEDVVEEDLHKLFGKYGTVLRCNIIRDKDTGSSRGFGFVVFHDHKIAQRAADELNGYGLDNLIMKVDFANNRK